MATRKNGTNARQLTLFSGILLAMTSLTGMAEPHRIDTHIHLWDPTRPGGIDWPTEKEPKIFEPILPETFHKTAKRHNVDRAIVVEASGRIEDNQWLLHLIKPYPEFFVGVVGNLPVGTPAFAENLKTLSQDERYKGIRIRNLPDNQLSEAIFSDLALLSEKGLTLDLLIRNITLDQAAQIAERLPDLKIILNHVAGAHHTGEPMPDDWQSGIAEIAAHPNVYCKVSGLFEHCWTVPAPKNPEHYTLALEAIWKSFGEDRLVFGSNWPVTRNAGGTYSELLHIIDSFLADKGDDVQAKVYGENASRFYGLK